MRSSSESLVHAWYVETRTDHNSVVIVIGSLSFPSHTENAFHSFTPFGYYSGEIISSKDPLAIGSMFTQIASHTQEACIVLLKTVPLCPIVHVT